MPTREEFQERLLLQREEHRRVAAEQQTVKRQVAEQARTVVYHPGWQMFCDHLDAVARALDARIATLTRQMEDGQELGEALTALKIQLREMKGERRGITTALELIPDLIKAGEQAVEPAAHAPA